MKGLNETLADLASLRANFQKIPAFRGVASGATGSLLEIPNFGSNPGNLRMLTHRPNDLPASAPLVVALHGCTQTAEIYDHGSGWSAVADALGFSVIFPEQLRVNNPNNCFSWFNPDDTRRGSGEASSIAQMVEHMIEQGGVDRKRVFVVGLSAGAAMAASMLATYPDLFAGGAIIAGLPHGAAANVQEALQAMSRAPKRPAAEWGNLVRAASSKRGPWPKVSFWHGSADVVVEPGNTEQAIKQWIDVHNLPPVPIVDRVAGHSRRVWRDRAGDVLIEAVVVDGMNHGVAIATTGTNAFGNAGPFHFDVGISSSFHIARFWGIADEVSVPATKQKRPASSKDASERPVDPAVAYARADSSESLGGLPRGRTGAFDPRKIIEKTLRSVGLLPKV